MSSVTNQRLYLAVVIGGVFLAVFALTTVILLTFVAPGREAATGRSESPIAPIATERAPWSATPPPDDRARATTGEDWGWPPSEMARPPREPWRAGETGWPGSYPGIRAPDRGQTSAWSPARSPTPDAWQTPRSERPSYQFRPLDERERQRMGLPDHAFGDGASVGTWMTPDPASEWGSAYRFRPLDPPRTSRETPPRSALDPIDPWFPGSTRPDAWPSPR